MTTFGRLLCPFVRSFVLERNSFSLQPLIVCSRLYSTDQYEFLKVEKQGEKKNVALIQLNRPRAMNALNDAMISELNSAIDEAESDKDIGAIVLTGSHRAFAVGADIDEMSKKSFSLLVANEFPNFSAFTKSRKVIVAAVNGYALGGGCELAMMCDVIYAGEKAQFGQPEITLGTIPGIGGTQRLTKAIGKSKAMEMILTGNRMSAQEAEKSGLVSKVFPPEQLVEETIKIAEKMANFSRTIAIMCKECINTGYDINLVEGIHFEKRISNTTFSTHDRKEGMTAFLEKRSPAFKDC